MTRTLRMITALVMAVASLAMLPARGAAQAPRTCPTFSPATLPATTEGTPYSAKLFSGPGQVSVYWAPTNGLTVRDSMLSGTPAGPGLYRTIINLTLDYACEGFSQDGHQKYTIQKSYTTQVKDLHPPQVASFASSSSTLTASGGTITVTVQAVDNFVVAKALLTTTHPDGHSGSTYLPQVSGATAASMFIAAPAPSASVWKQNITLPSNTSSSPVVYSFAITVSDKDLNAAKAGPVTVTIAGRAPSTEIPRPRLPGR